MTLQKSDVRRILGIALYVIIAEERMTFKSSLQRLTDSRTTAGTEDMFDRI